MRNIGEKPDGYPMVALRLGLADPSLLGVGQGVHGFCLKHTKSPASPACARLVVALAYHRSGVQGLVEKGRGEEEHTRSVSLLKPDIVTWSALITGFSQAGDNNNALHFFRAMNREGVKADPVMVVSALAASAQLAIVGPGCELHGHVLRHGLEIDVMVSSTLIDMYSKCGFIDLAMLFFRSLSRQNVVMYNSVILGLGSDRLASQVFAIFYEMSEKGLELDESMFVALLHACCHAGLVKDGKDIFSRMKHEFAIEPRTEHYVHIVKLLGMAGELKEAYILILTFPEPVDASIWGGITSML
ncbi:hypothetical protein Ancab_022973 [Ancistrocladus abbreviatus]